MDDDQVRDGLGRAAEHVSVGDPGTALDDVHTVRTRRRRRRTVLAGVGVATLLVGGVATVVTLDDSEGDDLLRTASPSTTIPATTTIAPGPATDAPATGESDEPPAGSPDELPDATSTEPLDGELVPVPSFGTGDGSGFVEWLVPWKDGFLAGGTMYQPQPLPAELPPEVVDLFSPEVVELFADGLPSTIDEASAMLTEAGLLDEVLAVINDNPAASDAIYLAPTSPQAVVQFSVDGEQWTPVDMTLPDDTSRLHDVSVVGERLVIVDAPPDPTSSRISIASTTDLTTWDTQVVEAFRPSDLPDGVQFNAWPSTIAVNESGWVLGVNASSFVDFGQFLPDEVAEAVRSTGGGYSSGPDGIKVEVASAAGGETDVINYTWAELGIAEEVVRYNEGPPRSEIWAAPFGGVPAKSDFDAGFVANIVATSDGFLMPVPEFVSSADGLTWTEVDAAPDGLFPTALAPVDDGLVVFTSAVDGAGAAYLVDPTLADWTPVEIPGAPDFLSSVVNNTVRAPAIIVDASPPQHVEQTISFEADGFRLTQSSSGVTSIVSYELVEIASGAIVLSESVDLRTLDTADYVGTGPFANMTHSSSGGGITIVDPVAGEVLVVIPQETVDQAYDEAFSQMDLETEEYRPDLWLIAYKGSNDWLVDDIADVRDPYEGYYGPTATAINGDTLLVAANGEWLSYDLGS